ncbi:DUF4192 family protein, partial [Streptomyces sp. NRRL WC-3549]|uniref:DUF4192 family protein n=1 Tax=Streptomyces sp. NRRL WC-3549 TaxID=1463925 RepID=UPI00131D1AFF
RRCVGSYVEHSAAPLALAGWVSWSTGDEPGARVALGLALRADPDYTFAQLLHQACNEGLDPETLRRCLRGERDLRAAAQGGAVPAGGPGLQQPALPRPRRRPARSQAAGRVERAAREAVPMPGPTPSGPGAARPRSAVHRKRTRGYRVQGRRGARSGR